MKSLLALWRRFDFAFFMACIYIGAYRTTPLDSRALAD